MRRLRYALKKWSKGLSRLKVLIQNTEWAVNELDEIENLRTLTTPESNFRRILKTHLLQPRIPAASECISAVSLRSNSQRWVSDSRSAVASAQAKDS